MPDSAVVDYGTGTLRSVAKALRFVAPERTIVVSSDPAQIRSAERVVLPGQSAMPDCMRSLSESGLTEVVLQTSTDRPFLGICLGLQMLFDDSTEGPTPGLGVLAGGVVRFREAVVGDADGGRLEVPHMGWSLGRRTREHPLWQGIDDGARFYFAHSYYPQPNDPDITAARVEVPTAFTCVVARANIFVVHFPPQKTPPPRLHLLCNFAA